MGKVFHFKGRRYRSISELAREYDMSIMTLTYRINAGWELDKAIIKPDKKGSKYGGSSL